MFKLIISLMLLSSTINCMQEETDSIEEVLDFGNGVLVFKPESREYIEFNKEEFLAIQEKESLERYLKLLQTYQLKLALSAASGRSNPWTKNITKEYLAEILPTVACEFSGLFEHITEEIAPKWALKNRVFSPDIAQQINNHPILVQEYIKNLSTNDLISYWHYAIQNNLTQTEEIIIQNTPKPLLISILETETKGEALKKYQKLVEESLPELIKELIFSAKVTQSIKNNILKSWLSNNKEFSRPLFTEILQFSKSIVDYYLDCDLDIVPLEHIVNALRLARELGLENNLKTLDELIFNIEYYFDLLTLEEHELVLEKFKSRKLKYLPESLIEKFAAQQEPNEIIKLYLEDFDPNNIIKFYQATLLTKQAKGQQLGLSLIIKNLEKLETLISWMPESNIVLTLISSQDVPQTVKNNILKSWLNNNKEFSRSLFTEILQFPKSIVDYYLNLSIMPLEHIVESFRLSKELGLEDNLKIFDKLVSNITDYFDLFTQEEHELVLEKFKSRKLKYLPESLIEKFATEEEPSEIVKFYLENSDPENIIPFYQAALKEGRTEGQLLGFSLIVKNFEKLTMPLSLIPGSDIISEYLDQLFKAWIKRAPQEYSINEILSTKISYESPTGNKQKLSSSITLISNDGTKIITAKNASPILQSWNVTIYEFVDGELKQLAVWPFDKKIHHIKANDDCSKIAIHLAPKQLVILQKPEFETFKTSSYKQYEMSVGTRISDFSTNKDWSLISTIGSDRTLQLWKLDQDLYKHIFSHYNSTSLYVAFEKYKVFVLDQEIIANISPNTMGIFKITQEAVHDTGVSIRIPFKADTADNIICVDQSTICFIQNNNIKLMRTGHSFVYETIDLSLEPALLTGADKIIFISDNIETLMLENPTDFVIAKLERESMSYKLLRKVTKQKNSKFVCCAQNGLSFISQNEKQELTLHRYYNHAQELLGTFQQGCALLSHKTLENKERYKSIMTGYSIAEEVAEFFATKFFP